MKRPNVKRVLCILLTAAMLATSYDGYLPSGIALAKEVGETAAEEKPEEETVKAAETTILLNAADTSTGTVTVQYGETLEASLSDTSSYGAVTFYYLSQTQSDWESPTMSELTATSAPLPGAYYLIFATNAMVFSSDADIYGTYTKFSFTVEKTKLATPASVAWDSENQDKATWSAVTADANGRALDADAAVTYSVELYKNGSKVTAVTTNNAYYDFSSAISENSYGTYTFKVTAIITAGSGDDRYLNSSQSDASADNSYTDTVKPTIASYAAAGQAAGGEGGKLVVTASDNVGVTAYYFSTESDVTKVTGSEEGWQAVTSDMTSEGVTTISKETFTSSACWYVYVKDAENNIAGSSKGINVSKVSVYSDFADDGEDEDIQLNTTTPTETIYLLGNNINYTPASKTQEGYAFGGWFSDAAFENSLTSLSSGTAPADHSIYAKWTRQGYSMTLTADQDSITYEGTGAGAGITLTGEIGNVDGTIAYTWQKNTAAEGDPVWTDLEATGTTDASGKKNSLTLYNVADTGVYRIKATITVGGKTRYGYSGTKEITISPAALTVQLKSQTIAFGDEAPEFTLSTAAESTTGLAGSETLAGLLSAGSLRNGSYTTDYTKGDSVGSYTISQSAADPVTADNYTVTVNDGTLTVTAKDVTKSGSGVALKFTGTDEGGSTVYSDTYSTVYTGSEIKPENITAFDGVSEISSDYYDITYSNNTYATTEASKAKITLTFKGNYTGALTISFDITKAENTALVQMEDGDGNPVAESDCKWTYGGTALSPYVTSNPDGAAVHYYYALTSGGETLNTASAATTMPEDAGQYYVWAVIDEGDNYQSQTTAPLAFTIRKKTITFTAASKTWDYDGSYHSDDSYTMDGAFEGADGFNAVTVTGSIKDVGTIANVVDVTLTPSTNADNYNIVEVDGVLTITQTALPTPSNYDWESGEPGAVSWTPVSQNNVEVSYLMNLYRVGNATPIDTQTITTSEYSAYSQIKADSLANGVGGYYITIQALPTGGSEMANVGASEIGTSSTIHTLKFSMAVDATSMHTNSQAFKSTTENVWHTLGDSLIVMNGEKITTNAYFNTGYGDGGLTFSSNYSGKVGYSRVYWVSGDTTIGYLDTISIGSGLASSGDLTVTYAAKDAAPVISSFKAENVASSKYTQVKFSLTATDGVGLAGYAIYKDKNAAARAGDSSFASSLNFSSFTSNSGSSYTASTYLKEAGTYYVAVKDTAGNIVYLDDSLAITVYEVKFSNGKTDAEDASIYGGTDMATMYKVRGSNITLPACTYTKTGYAFKNWVGSSSSSMIGDGGTYAANVNEILAAEWSSEQYEYTVNYYYMDLTGAYGEPETKTYSGGYGTRISSTSAALAMDRTGFTRDTTVDPKEATLGTDENPVINIYYKRNQYTITYKYTDPTDADNTVTFTPAAGVQTTFYYEETYSLAAEPSFSGYTFSGWSFTDFDSAQTTMPAKNLTAVGSYTAKSASYVVRTYLQDLPSTTGSIAGGDYAETAATTYTGSQYISYTSKQGSSVSNTVSDAPEIDGFTAVGVYMTSGAIPGTEKPDGVATSASGTVDCVDTLYVNYYYTRNQHDFTLNVWKDKRDTDGNKMFTKTWTISYGHVFSYTKDGVEVDEAQQMATYGYSETDTENEWIASYMENGERKEDFKTYVLADFTDWSTGTKPTTMADGDATITKEYVNITTEQYEVDLYLEDIKNNEVYYKDTATYSVFNYETIGKTLVLKDSTQDTGADNQVTVDYANYLKMLETNYSSYELDTEKTTFTSATLEGDGDVVISVYFKRAKVSTQVTYWYYTGGSAQKIIQYDYWKEWGTKYNFEPLAYYYGDSSYDSLDNAAIPTGSSTRITDGVAPTDTDYSGITYNATYLGMDFNALNCNVSYNSRYRLESNGGTSWPSTNFSSEDQLVSVTRDEDGTITGSPTKKTVAYVMGQYTSSISSTTYDGYKNYINVYYSPIDTDKTYYKPVVYGSSSNTPLTETVGENSCTITGLTAYDAATGSYTAGGEELTGTYNIYVANKKDLLTTTETDGNYGSLYQASRANKLTYSYSGVQTGFTPVLVTTSFGSDIYFLQDGTSNLFIADKLNNMYVGNYLYLAVESSDYCNNLAKLGRVSAKAQSEAAGYNTLTYMGSYGIYSPADTSGWTWKSVSRWYYYSENVYTYRALTFNMGSKTATKYVLNNTDYTLYEDSFVSTTFTVDEGYRIVWYKNYDAATKTYSNPVGEDETITITANKTFYGHREKNLVTNYDYVSYELSDDLTKDSTILAKASQVSGRYYVTENNYTDFTWVDSESATSTDRFVKTDVKVDRTYINSNSGSDEEVTYKANFEYYSIDGETVMIRGENKAMTFSTVSLPYTDAMYNGDSGFAYDVRDTNNKTAGYCQKEGISLTAYFYRQIFTFKRTVPASDSPKKNNNYLSTYKYGSSITLMQPTKVGYTFDGWDYTEIVESGTEPAKTITPKSTGSNYIVIKMPGYDLHATATWTPAEFNTDVYSYFMTSDESYDTDSVNAIAAADAAGYTDSVTFTYNGAALDSAANTRLVYTTDAKSVILGVAIDIDDVTYYFGPGIYDSESATAKGTQMTVLGGKQTVTLTSEQEYSVSDYLPNVSVFSIYDYGYSVFADSDKVTTSLANEDTFTAEGGMALNNYFSRSSKLKIRTMALADDATEESAMTSGLTVMGDGDTYYYGEEVTLTAVVATGYTFKGWYLAKDILPGYTTFANASSLASFTYADADKLAAATPIASTGSEDTYTAKVTVTEDVDYVAVSTPIGFGDSSVARVTISGTSSYVYGHLSDAGDTLTAKVTIADDQKDAISIQGYQWYLVDAENGAAGSEQALSGETSDIINIDNYATDAGTYYFQCRVNLKRNDNNRTGSVLAAKAYTIAVRQYGLGEREVYVSGSNKSYTYTGTQSYGIQLNVENTADAADTVRKATPSLIRVPSKYEIYFSTEAVTSWADVQAGLADNTAALVKTNASVSSTDNATALAPFIYQDVELDASGNPVAHTVYWYLRTEEEDLDPNYVDKYGSNTITIQPATVVTKRTATPFFKTYDASTSVTGDDYDRLTADNTTYYTLTSTALDSETDDWYFSTDAAFNTKDKETASEVTLSNMAILYKTATTDSHGNAYAAGAVDPNYTFDPTSVSLSGYINPYPLTVKWSTDDSFVYDGEKHAPTVSIDTTKCTPPDASCEIEALGGQTSVGTNYKATASLVTTGKTYTAGDYTFTDTGKLFNITTCPLVVKPAAKTVTYNGQTQYLTGYEIVKAVSGVATTKSVNTAGTSDNLLAGQYIKMDSIKNDKGGKNAGTYTVSVIKDSIKIYDAGGKDITYNYNITASSNTLTINPATVTIKLSDGSAVDKEYDGKTKTSLKTETVSINDTDKTVVSNVIYQVSGRDTTGLYTGDTAYIDASKVSNVNFSSAAVNESGDTVTFDLATGALIGDSADNYTLDIANSTLSTTAKITRHVITVTVTDLSAGTVYGVTPAFAVTYSGWENGDTTAGIVGSQTPTYLLDGSAITDVNKINVGTYTITLKTDSNGYVDGITADNYVFVQAATQTDSTATGYSPAKLKITQRPVTLTRINRATTISKVYDSTTAVTTTLVKDTDYQFDAASSNDSGKGVLSGESIDITYTAVYNDEDVADATTIKVTNAALTDTDAAKNYYLTNTAFDIDGLITKAPLTAVADTPTAINYGDAAPTYTATVSGFVGSDKVDGSDTKSMTNGSGITIGCDYDTSVAANRKAGSYEITPTAIADTNYELTTKTAANLTVKKKTITITPDAATLVYGKDSMTDRYTLKKAGASATALTGTTAGWVTAYGDSESLIATEMAGVKYGISATDYNSGLVYKENGYTISVENAPTTTLDNYTITTKTNKLSVVKSYLSISGITTTDKVYDGTTTLLSKDVVLDPDSITFTCYVSGSGSATYKAADIWTADAGDSDKLKTDLANAISVTGTYDNKNVGTGKTVTLNVTLKSGGYLDNRYELLTASNIASASADYSVSGAVATQTKTTDGEITARPVTLKLYYGSASNSKILYGTSPALTSFGYSDVTAGTTDKGFVSGEGALNAAGNKIDVLTGSIAYGIVNASGVEYSTSSGVGTYYVKMTGSLADAANLTPNVNGNYIVTLINGNISATPSSVTVASNTLATPAPEWKSANPGTVSFAEVSGFGDVEVDHYELKIYKNATAATVKAGTASADYTETITTTNHSADLSSGVFSIDYAAKLRELGPGSYIVGVQAIAETGTDNPTDNRNVNDSGVGTSGGLYVAKVTVGYATDTVTAAASIGNATKTSTITIAGASSYNMIDGESANIAATWYNKDGYQTGYKVADTPWTIQQNSADSTCLTITSTMTNGGSVPAKIALTSSDDVTVALSLAQRPATLDLTLNKTKDTAYYEYETDDAPHFSATAAPASTDNVAASDGDYTYTYSWKYKKVTETTWSELYNQDTTPSSTTADMVVMQGLAQGRYNIQVTVTATRKDNNATAVSASKSAIFTVARAVISDSAAKASVTGWTYGSTRNAPALKINGRSTLPSGLGTIHYYFRESGETDWTEWTTTAYPMDAGDYELYAKVDQSENYEAISSLENITTFTIAATKLGAKAVYDAGTTSIIKGADLATADLAMSPASNTAPYGLISWPAVYEPQENTDGKTRTDHQNYITASYKVVLYKYNSGSTRSSATTVATYTSGYKATANADGTTTYSLNVASKMNGKSIYYYTVTPLSSNTTDCADGDTVTSVDYQVSTDVTVKDADGIALTLNSSKETSYTYDGRDVTFGVSVDGVTVDAYQWYKDGVAITGATASTTTARYVADSGIYTCQLTIGGSTFYTSYVKLTVKPRTLTIHTGSISTGFIHSAITKDEWSIKENADTNTATSSESLTETATGNTVSGITVTGSQTNVTASTVKENNTISLASTVITEASTNAVVYNASMVTAGTANYDIKQDLGTIAVTARSLGDGTATPATGITVSALSNFVYNGYPRTQSLTIQDVGQTIVSGTDYTVSYTSNTYAGTATLTITGTGNFTGSIVQTYTISKRPLVVLSESKSKTYDGNALTSASGTTAAAKAADVSKLTVTNSDGATDQAGLAATDELGSVTFTGTITNQGSVDNTYTNLVVKASSGGTDVTANYTVTCNKGTLTVTQATDTLTITKDISKTYDKTAVSDPGTRGNGVTYNSLNTGTLTFKYYASDGTTELTQAPTDAGSYYVKAFVSATSNYAACESALKAFTIAPKVVTLEWSCDGSKVTTAPALTYDGSSHSVTASVTNACTGDTVTVSGYTAAGTTVNTATETGSYTAEAITLGGADAANYTLTGTTNPTRTWSIKKSSRSLTAADVTVTYDGNSHEVTPVVGGTDAASVTPTVTYVSKTSGVSLVGGLPVNAGSYTAKVSLAATTNYEAATTTATVTINAKSLGDGTATPATGITVSDLSNYVYNGSARTQNVTVSYGLITLASGSDYTVSYKDNTNAGTATITLTGKTNYSGSIVKTYTISKRPITVKSEDKTKSYDGSALTSASGTASSNKASDVSKLTVTNNDTVNDLTGLASTDALSSVTFTGTITDTGSTDNTYTDVKIKKSSGSTDVTANYTITCLKGTLTVTQATDTLTITKDISKTYDKTAVSDPGTRGNGVSYNSLNTGTLTFKYYASDGTTELTQAPTDAGSYYVKAFVSATGNYAACESALKAFTIAPKVVSLKWYYDGTAVGSTAPSIAYDGAAHTVTASVTNACTGDTVTISGYTAAGTTVNTATESGSYTAEASTLGGADAANYTLTGASKTTQAWSIGLTERSLSVSNVTVTYDGTTHEVSPVIGGTDADLVTPTITYKANTSGVSLVGGLPVHAGSYTATVKVAATENYKAASTTATVTISKRAITITSDSASKTYDGSPLTKHSFTATRTAGSSYSGSALAAADSIDNDAITYTGTITDVAYASGAVTTVKNTYTTSTVAITNALAGSVTKDYNITFATGSLKINPLDLSTVSGSSTIGQVLLTASDGSALPTDTFDGQILPYLVYTGSAVGPKVTAVATLNPATGANLVTLGNTDITISNSPADNKVVTATAVDTYTVEITGKGNYTGSVASRYAIKDTVAPAVAHAESTAASAASHSNGKYCKSVYLSAEDPNLTGFKVERIVSGEVTLVSNKTTANGGITNGKAGFVLTGSDADAAGSVYRITAKDISGNETIKEITLYQDHSFTDYSIQDLSRDASGQAWKAYCDHECGADDARVTNYTVVNWDYTYTTTTDSGSSDGVQSLSARTTYARVDLLRDGRVINTAYVNCADTCGSDVNITSASHDVNFTVDKSGNPLPYADADGTAYTYTSQVTPVNPAEDGSYTENYDYSQAESTAGRQVYGQDIIAKDVTLRCDPNPFRVQWKVTMENNPTDESGNTVYPEKLYVKVLYAYSETATDAEDASGYRTFGSLANDGNLGVVCEPVVAADGTVTYAGDYPVWKTQASNSNPYYYRIQVVGYEKDGTYYDVTAKNFKSVNDTDHVNHTIYYVASSGKGSGVIKYTMESQLPSLKLMLNDKSGKAFAILYRGIDALGNGGSVSWSDVEALGTPVRKNYKFKGWFTESKKGTQVESDVDLSEGSVILYAHWSETSAGASPEVLDQIIGGGDKPGTDDPTPGTDNPGTDTATPTDNPTGTDTATPTDNPTGTATPAGTDKEESENGGSTGGNTGGLQVIVKNPTDTDGGRDASAEAETSTTNIIGELPDPEAVAEVVLTAGEKTVVSAGGNVIIRLTVDDSKRDTPSKKEDAALHEMLDQLTEEAEDGQTAEFLTYVDLTLEKKISNADWKIIEKTGSRIGIILNIPEELLDKGDDICLIVKTENGYEMVTDTDDDPTTITFYTDDFTSEYALIGMTQASAGILNDCYWHWIMLILLAIYLLLWLISLFTKKKEKKSKARKLLKGLSFTILMVILAILGSCSYDIPVALLCEFTLGIAEGTSYLHRRNRLDAEEEAKQLEGQQ